MLVISLAALAAVGVVRICLGAMWDDGARTVVIVLCLGWIGFWLWVALAGGGFLGLISLAPYFILKKAHG